MPRFSSALSPYLRLMRLHQPIGIWLVYWPCVWALSLATLLHYHQTGESLAPLALLYMALFLAGAVVMRSAGCIINDIADRHFDGHVERTRLRPLASGELTVKHALLALIPLLLLATIILLLTLWLLPPHSSILHLLAVALPVSALIVAYPFMKRITWWPQAFLGITFNWGVLISWASLRGTLDTPALLLYAACLFWTLAYDTVYGHQDKTDDVKIGVKSTALLLGHHGKWWIGGFYLCMCLCYGLATAAIPPSSLPDIAGLSLIAGFALWSLHHTDLDTPAQCLTMFRRNATLGLLLGLWLTFSGLLPMLINHSNHTAFAPF